MTPILPLLALSFATQVASHFLVDDEDGRFATPQITQKYGYETETHKVETSDGFILELHRLSGSPSSGPFDEGKPPVLLMHGLMGSSADWIIIGPQNALAYLLSDRGYDVWLGNARGNRYSREHAHLRIDTKEFWDFSWHEIGTFDVPAIIDYILEVRCVPKLHYIGHSQGTTAFFVMTSMLTEYNDKIIRMQALAPAAYMNHLKNPMLRFLATHMNSAESVVNMLGISQFVPAPHIFHHITSALCPYIFNGQYCVNTMFLLSAGKYQNLDPKIIPVLVGHIPAGASVKQVLHYGQEVLSGHFRQFDYGVENNTRIYHSPVPSDYNLTNVRAPVVIHYGLNDQLTHPADVVRLARELPNLVDLNQHSDPSFNHMDFLLATSVKDTLYNSIIDNMEESNCGK